MKEYHGLKAEKIEFSESSVIATSNCQSIMAYSQAPEGDQYWYLCQEAYNNGKPDPAGEFGEQWYGNRGTGNPDV